MISETRRYCKSLLLYGVFKLFFLHYFCCFCFDLIDEKDWLIHIHFTSVFLTEERLTQSHSLRKRRRKERICVLCFTPFAAPTKTQTDKPFIHLCHDQLNRVTQSFVRLFQLSSFNLFSLHSKACAAFVLTTTRLVPLSLFISCLVFFCFLIPSKTVLEYITYIYCKTTRL